MSGQITNGHVNGWKPPTGTYPGEGAPDDTDTRRRRRGRSRRAAARRHWHRRLELLPGARRPRLKQQPQLAQKPDFETDVRLSMRRLTRVRVPSRGPGPLRSLVDGVAMRIQTGTSCSIDTPTTHPSKAR
jgi:hypothetical protein